MTYNIDPRSYLKRAKERIDDGSLHSLFYAAFELLCGIEARMQQYLDVQEHISKQKKKGWQIAKLGRNIENIFRTGNKVAKLTLFDEKLGKHFNTLYYTPVTSSLRKKGEKLGNNLHAAKKLHPPDDAWWKDFRQLLLATYEDLKISTTGTLLGPALMHPNKRQLDMKIELLPNEDHQKKISEIGSIGTMLRMKVEYLDSLPKK
jgi:hypothetical protein